MALVLTDKQYARGLIDSKPVIRILLHAAGETSIHAFLTETEQRRWHEWTKNDKPALFELVDRLFCRLGLVDHFWYDPELREEYYRVSLKHAVRLNVSEAAAMRPKCECHGEPMRASGVGPNGKRYYACARKRRAKDLEHQRARRARQRAARTAA